MDLTGGLAESVKALPTEIQPILIAALERISALEAQTVKDESAIAKQVIDGLAPIVKQAVDAINQITLTVDASVQEITGLARRVDGMIFEVKLGPEPGA